MDFTSPSTTQVLLSTSSHVTTAFLITNYCNWRLTSNCVDLILQWSAPLLSRIVIVDDHSDAPHDGHPDPRVQIIRNQRNLGYVASVNVGMAAISEEVVIVLDADAHPLMELSQPALEVFSQNPQVGQLAFHEVGTHGSRRIAGETEPDLLEFILGQRLGTWLSAHRVRAVSRDRFCAHSCCMAVRTAAFHDVGGFDERFDFLDADMDFSWRLQESGWQLLQCPELKAFHQGGGSPQSTSTRVIRHHRNRLLFFLKHRQLKFLPLLKAALFVRHSVELSGILILGLLRRIPSERFADLLRGRFQLLATVWRGYEGAHLSPPGRT